jgi:hemolysin III
MDYKDAVSSLTHLFTAGWAVFATLILLRLTRGHGPGRWAVGIYGLTMVLLYLASGVFHGILYLITKTVFDPDDRAAAVSQLWVAQRLDKSAIFALIAGSYTPVFVYLLAGAWRRWCLIAVWSIAAAGIGSIWLWPSHPHPLLVGVYVGMGLVGLVPMPKYLVRIGWKGLLWAAAFGGAFLSGAAVEVAQWPTLIPGYFGPHEFLHVADAAGTMIHVGFVVKFLLRRPPPTPAEDVRLTARVIATRMKRKRRVMAEQRA